MTMAHVVTGNGTSIGNPSIPPPLEGNADGNLLQDNGAHIPKAVI